jgi:glycine C-acetyltransferase
MSKFSFMHEELNRLEIEGLRIYPRTIESPQGAWLTVDGRKVLNMCSNNYLGFANHPRLAAAAKKAIDEYGVGPTAVRSIAGTMNLHRKLEERLAAFKKVEATLSFQSGFTSNQAIIPILVGDTDTIFSDELNHASIIDGCRLARGKTIRYRHGDASSLESMIRQHGAGRKLIITDGVFSMDGDLAPLPDIVEVAERYEAIVMVDDAHGEGVIGSHGRGISDHFGLHGRVDIEVGTLSKAFGVIGGYIAGTRLLADFLQQKARPFLFSSAATPADVAACLAAVEILEESDEAVKKLWANAAYFKNKMRDLGFDLGRSQTPITPVMIGSAKEATAMSHRLFEEGIFAMPIGFPTVPHGQARIRVMISATHSREDLDFAMEKFNQAGRESKLI